jgi:membrane fusion protein, multidrug efflux system
MMGYGARHGTARRLGAAVIAAASLLLAACRGGRPASAEPDGDAVTVGPENIYIVRQAVLHSGPVISGSLEPERQATVRAQVGGAVLQTYAEPGDRVKRGTVLARIDDTAIRDSYLSAKSAEAAAEQTAQLAQHNLERSQKLEAAGAIAKADLESAQATSASAASQLAEARSRLADAHKQLDETVIRSPMDGVVSARPVNAGDVVQVGSALFTVVDPTSMRLKAAVPANDLDQVHLGAPVQFDVRGYPDAAFDGRISKIEPVADPATRQVGIQVSLPNDGGRLVGGLFADGRIDVQTATGLVVPFGAVTESGGPPSVLRLRNGRAEQVPVETGLRDERAELVQVTGKLAVGDTLLTGAAQGVAPGSVVRVQSAAEAAGAGSGN